MKKILFFAATVAMMASCADSDIIENGGLSQTGKNGAIGFVMQNKNMTRSYTDLQTAGHYNFGVFAYKSTDMVNPVMPNYLVGYYDDAKAYQKTGTTVGDQEGQVDGQSYWMYEGMGNTEYHGTYAGSALTDAFKSNNANQYLKYWDNSAATTAFYAYAPYINSGVKSTVTYVDGTAQAATGNDTYVMCFPDGTIEAGMDNAALSEYMYAYNKVAKADYGHDVPLQFHRLNAKVNIKFWEDVPGYKVRILDLSNSYKGVQAAASIKDGSTPDFGYKGGKFYKKNGVKISFAGATPAIKQFVGTVQTNSEPLVFAAPTAAQIGENRFAASASASTYYAIPKGQGSNLLAGTSTDFNDAGAAEDGDFALTGFTFHVSYELTAEDTGEKIVVKNATVHVPCEYANWKANTHYTYIFKITKNSNGSTESTPSIDPSDPEVPTTPALYPIVFDNCTVVDWDENESEWEITENKGVIYHDVQLSTYSLVSGNIDITVTDNDTYAGHGINYSNITLAGPLGAITLGDGSGSTWKYVTAADKGTLTVPAGAAAGVYTVTYTCPATYDKTTHVSTWTETFVVGNEYTITTHRDVIGTNWSNAATEAKLNVSGTITTAGGTTALTVNTANLSIEYPDNFKDPHFTADQLTILRDAVQISGTDVVVKKNALPGVYKVVYSIVDPVDGTKKIKVAEKQFTVVDYSLVLSHTTVFNAVGGTTVTGNQTADASHVYSVSGPDATNVTVTSGTNNVVVANNAGEGTYTVTYTVYGGQADETIYTKTFVVKNTYSVAVSKTSVDRNVGTSTSGGTSTDFITVSTKKNGVATAINLTSSLKVVDANGADAAGFTFTWDGSADTYKLELINTVPTGNYKVVYTGQSGAEYVVNAGFVVTE